MTNSYISSAKVLIDNSFRFGEVVRETYDMFGYLHPNLYGQN